MARKRSSKAKLGSGKRFASLKSSLKKRGARNPGALAAYIGRKKYGSKKMSQLSAAGRKRKSRSRKSSSKRRKKS